MNTPPATPNPLHPYNNPCILDVVAGHGVHWGLPGTLLLAFPTTLLMLKK